MFHIERKNDVVLERKKSREHSLGFGNTANQGAGKPRHLKIAEHIQTRGVCSEGAPPSVMVDRA